MGDTMSIVLFGSTSGSVTLQEPAAAGSTVLDLPSSSGTVGLVSGNLGTPSTLVGTNITGTANSLNAGLGVNQTWQSVTGSRAIGTTYTNSTGKPIMVIVSGTGDGTNGLWGVTINSAITFYTPSTYGASVWTTACFIVPNGNTYQLTNQGANATLQNWSELR